MALRRLIRVVLATALAAAGLFPVPVGASPDAVHITSPVFGSGWTDLLEPVSGNHVGLHGATLAAPREVAARTLGDPVPRGAGSRPIGHEYDAPPVARHDINESEVADASTGQAKALRAGPASPAVEGRSMSTTSFRSFLATNTAGTSGGGFGRGGQKLNPDPLADGAPHTTFRTDPSTGNVTHYTTWEPNLKNPIGYDPVKRFDGVGGSHYNKVLKTDIPTPHVQGPGIPGGTRTAEPWEVPGG